jgi:arylsulfatase A-like enzyme
MSEKPNIVFIVMDTARGENFSCNGYERKTSPFLDSLSEDSVKYERTISQANRTQISHASMFTGDYISEHRIDLDNSFADLDVFQDKLSEKGYRTLGATNVVYLSEEYDADEMFDDFFYNPGPSFFTDLSMSREEFRQGDGWRRYVDLVKTIVGDKAFLKPLEALKRKFRKYLFLEDSGARRTDRWVKEQLEDQEEPFFLFLNYLEPHGPYKPPFPYSHKFLDNRFRWFSLIDTLIPGPKIYPDDGGRPSEEKVELWKSLYDGEISYLDARLEKLHSWIKERYSNTVFIFTSDHGEHFLEKDLKGHSIGVYDEVTHVPLIEEFPDDVSGEIEEPVELRQLHDHVLSISEGDFEPIEGGLAFSEDMSSGERDTGRREKLLSYTVSVQDSEYKLIWYANGEKELFSMPGEEDIEDSELEEELSEKILDRIGDPEEMDLVAGQEKDVKDEKIKENLKDLGYM